MNSLFDPTARTRILTRLDSLSPDAERLWGTMTCPQAVNHMADALRAPLGRLDTQPLSPSLVLRTVGRFVALTLPLRWPKGVKTAPEFDQGRAGTPPGVFREDVARLKALIAEFVATEGSGLRPHLAFGDLRPGEWGRWGFRHLDHHLRQFGA